METVHRNLSQLQDVLRYPSLSFGVTYPGKIKTHSKRSGYASKRRAWSSVVRSTLTYSESINRRTKDGTCIALRRTHGVRFGRSVAMILRAGMVMVLSAESRCAWLNPRPFLRKTPWPHMEVTCTRLNFSTSSTNSTSPDD